MTFRPGGDGMMFHNFLRQLLNDGMRVLRDSGPPGQEIPHINIVYVEKYIQMEILIEIYMLIKYICIYILLKYINILHSI